MGGVKATQNKGKKYDNKTNNTRKTRIDLSLC